jgi:hypothetical protein
MAKKSATKKPSKRKQKREEMEQEYDTLSDKYDDYFPDLDDLADDPILYKEYCGKDEKSIAVCEGYAELKRVSQKVKRESSRKWNTRLKMLLGVGLLVTILVFLILYLPDMLTKVTDAIPEDFGS